VTPVVPVGEVQHAALPPLHMDEPPTVITPLPERTDMEFAQRALRAMDRYHGGLVGRAAHAWGITAEQLHAVLNLRELPHAALRALVEEDEKRGGRAR